MANILFKLPENCPICGTKMEIGYLRAISGGGASAVFWRTPDLGRWRGGGKRLNYGFFSADFRGVRCKRCKIIILGYSEDMKKIDTDKEHWLVYEIRKEKHDFEIRKGKHDFYEELLNLYQLFYTGRSKSKQVLEHKIKSIMKRGYNREEAIYKLAEEENLI